MRALQTAASMMLMAMAVFIAIITHANLVSGWHADTKLGLLTISDYEILMVLGGTLILPAPRVWTPRILAGVFGVMASCTIFSLAAGDVSLLLALGAVVGAGLLATVCAELHQWMTYRTLRPLPAFHGRLVAVNRRYARD